MDLYRKHHFVIILVFICVQKCCQAGILGGVGIAGAAAAIGAGINWGRCHVYECCNDKWTQPGNKSKDTLMDIFKNKLFGQHLVMKIVSNAVYTHIFDENPQKALVMSFHGLSGCGKNFVSSLIAEYTYKEGMSSAFVHTQMASVHYPKSGNVESYKNDLQEFIKTKTMACGRSLFIFDEIDKMPAGVIDALKPFIDYYHHIDGIDYRKNIFIFLSNIGSNQINEVTIQQFRNGAKREDIGNVVMEKILSLTSLKNHGGHQDSELILSGLVDFFVPFLPMERWHVKKCISAEIERHPSSKGFNKEDKIKIVEEVINEIQFYPKGENIFSTSGCKQITKKVDMYI